MIRLVMQAADGQISVDFDISETEENGLRMDELAAFSLHLDVVKHRLTELIHKAIAEADGHKLVVGEAN